MLEHALHPPKTSAGDHGGLDAVGRLGVHGRRGDDHGVLGRARGGYRECSDRQRADRGGAERKAAELATGHGGFLWGGRIGSSLGRKPPFAIKAALPDVPRYAARRALLPRKPHGIVDKVSYFLEVWDVGSPTGEGE